MQKVPKIFKSKITISVIFNFFQVRAMVQGRDRRVELGYQWAIELRKNIIYPPKNKNSKYNPVLPDEVQDKKTENPNENPQQEVSASA